MEGKGDGSHDMKDYDNHNHGSSNTLTFFGICMTDFSIAEIAEYAQGHIFLNPHRFSTM